MAHCEGSLEGDFVWSVTYCDIYSGWTANRAVWNKGSGGVVAATREVEGALPFELLGFDTDNGSEFLSWHLLRYVEELFKPKLFDSRGQGRQRDRRRGAWLSVRWTNRRPAQTDTPSRFLYGFRRGSRPPQAECFQRAQGQNKGGTGFSHAQGKWTLVHAAHKSPAA